MLELNKIYNMDCMEGMKLLDNESIDFVLTDPPYNIGLRYNDYDDNMNEEQFWTWIQSVFEETYRLLKPKSHITFTCAQKQIWVYKPLMENIGFTFRHLSVWHNPGRKAGSYPGQWPYSWEAILDFTKGGFRKLNNSNCVGFMDVWIEKPPGDSSHPARRPLNCWMDLVKLLSAENDIVLDPFIGSGSTAICCRKANRQFIGFEISEDYCLEANQRILQA